MSESQRFRVFVVDDEFAISSTLAIILSRSGFAADAFTNPIKALEAAKSEPPDLLISDVIMPEITGVDLAIQIRAAAPKCKILLFSGQAATADLLIEARAKGHDFTLLTKPVHPADLLCAVRNLEGLNSPFVQEVLVVRAE
ncbi:Chemotaxis regulator - transmits chemoreceptor signals to flagelllar motor components CheY (plasmid) [Acidisarcina polymorpha]|uniref:Chemotaxis regulator-transmits chemoreceptor signals to flagelllar motor components CheY n=1 Tax=Acidisarcina polymorpha TaxID=2211140 RepID=A0A2Z5GCH0_9BACT|nr:response regulator [Acidisarcina polymorpha]AXC16315.1 Chemotaxis regulator - transmits chemoreceptor signals to flagelllar motor components CheY [Acidisarcina polymorpha]